jgi:hypothetical protein
VQRGVDSLTFGVTTVDATGAMNRANALAQALLANLP